MSSPLFSRQNSLRLLLAALSSFALGHAHAQVATDDAAQSAYSGGWNNGSDGGSGFGNWDMWVSGGTGGHFRGGVASGFGNINSSGNSFAMWSGTGTANAQRSFDNDLAIGQMFQIRMAKKFRDGNSGIDIMNSSFALLYNFNISNSGYGSTGWSYAGDSIIEFNVRRDSSTGYTVILRQYSGGSLVNTSTTTHTFSTAPRIFKLYNSASGGGDDRNFYFNDLRIFAVPTAPTITGITPGNGTLSVAFSAPGNAGGSAVTNYEFSTNGGSTWTAVSPASTTSPILISGLTNGTSYNVQLRAVNAVGAGTATASTAATPRTTPGAPTGLALTAGNGTLTATFTAPSSDGGSAITNYEYSTNGGTNFTAVSPASTSTSIVISGLTNGTSYNVQIRAVNAAGQGTATASVAGTPRTTPTITTTTPATDITTTTATLGGNITSTGGANATERGIFWSTSNGFADGTGTKVSSTGSFGTGAFTVAVTSLTQSTVYYFKAFAVNPAGTVYGAQGTFTTASPAAATLTAATLSSALSNTYGTASSGVSFTASGNNLTGNITVTAQSGFEVSTSQSSNYGSSVSVATGTTVWVRVASTRAAGAFNSTTVAVLSGGGAASSANITSSASNNSVAQLAITGSFTASSKAYDGTTTATVATRSVSGKVGSDDVNHTGGTATFANATAGTGKTVTLTGATLTGAAAANYTLSSVSTTTADITALAITGTFTASNKTYDGNTSATVATRAVTGKIGSDDVNHTGGTATFANATAGTGKTVTLTGATLTGAAAANYTLSSVSTTTADITALAITGTFTANNKTYDGTTSATVATRAVTGKIGSDDVNHTGGTATFNNATVGTGKTVTLTGATLTGAAAANYTLGSVSTTTADISKATPTITAAPTASAIKYPLTLASSTLTGGSATGAGGAALPGNFAWTTGATVASPGTANYQATFTPTDTTNYNTTTTIVSLKSDIAQARNVGGAASPSQPSNLFVGDNGSFGLDSWGDIDGAWGQARVVVRPGNADLGGGTPGSYGGFTNALTKTVTSPRFNASGTWYWGIQMDYGGTYGSNFWYKAPSSSWTDMSTDGTGSSLSVTVSALNDPSGVAANAASPTSITVSWANGVSGTEKWTTVFRSTGSTPPALVQGTAYAVDTNHSIGGQTYRCIALGAGTSVTDSGLTPGTTYYYYVFAENFSHYSPGVTRSVALSSDFNYTTTTDTTEATVLAGSGSLTKGGNAELLLTGVNTYTGKTTINAGRLRIQADSGLGGVPANALADSITIGNATLALDGTITLNSNRGITLNGAATIDDWGNNDIYNGIIATASGATTSLTKLGGGNLTLGGNSSYTGLTTVNNGTLTITHAGALGATGTGNGTTVATGNALRLSGPIAVGNELLTLNGVGPKEGTAPNEVDSGALRNFSGDNSWSGALTLGSNARINADSGTTLTLSGGVAGGSHVFFAGGDGTVAISGAITGNGASGVGATLTDLVTSIYKDFPGTLTLSGANTYTGATRVLAGNLTVSGSGTLGSGSDVYLSSGATLTVNANATVPTLRETGSGNGGTVTISNGVTLTVNGANRGTFFQNSIGGIGGNLTFSGTGTTILSLYNSQGYSGTTTVNSGILTSSGAMSTATVSIAGGTFRLTDGGTVTGADITIGTGAAFDIAQTTSGTSLGANKVLTASATGANTTGTLTVATGKDYSLGTGSLRFSAYGGGATPPLTVSGTGGNLNLNSRAVSVTSTAQLGAGTYTLIAKSGTANVTGAPSPTSITVGGSGSVGAATLGVTSGELFLTVAKGSQGQVTGTLASSTIIFGATTTVTGSGGSGTGAYEFRQNGGTGSVSFSGSGDSRTISATTSGTAVIEVRRVADANYNDSDWVSAGTLTVNKATPTITTNPVAAAITYGQALSAATLTGGAGSVPGTFAFTSAGTTPNATMATNFNVTFTPTDTANYNAVSLNVSVTVNPKVLTGSFTAENKVYDGTTTATVATRAVAGKVGDDDVNHTGGTATFANATVGTGKTVTLASATLTGAASSNYTLSSVSTTTANITQATPTITAAPTASAITAGQPLSASTLSGGAATGVGGGGLDGGFAFTTPGTIPAVGTASQGVTFTPNDTTNYSTATTTVSVTVNSASQPLPENSDLVDNQDGTFTLRIDGQAASNASYLYTGRTNGVGQLKAAYAFMTYSNSNPPAAPGFYTVTATASGYTGTRSTNFGKPGLLLRTLELGRIWGTASNSFSRATTLTNLQRIDTNLTISNGASGVLWTNISPGLSTLTNAETSPNTVVNVTSNTWRLFPANSNSLVDTLSLTLFQVSGDTTPMVFPVVVTATSSVNAPRDLQITRLLPIEGNTNYVRALFMMRPNRAIQIEFKQTLNDSWRPLQDPSLPVTRDHQNLTTTNANNEVVARPMMTITPPNGVLELTVPASGMFFRGWTVK